MSTYTRLGVLNVPVQSSTAMQCTSPGNDYNDLSDLSDHVIAVCRSAYYQLRQLRTIARSLSDDAA